MRAALLIVLAGCAGAPKPSTATATATATPTSTPTATETAAPPPVPTGGHVMVGDIAAPKGFDPKPAILAFKQGLLDCYDQARAAVPDLRGKVTLRIEVNEAGAVLGVSAQPGGHANDPSLVLCIDAAMKERVRFPKPGGMATVLAPLVFVP